MVLHDAGVGREDAGIAGLGLLAGLGIPAATVDHASARIGDGAALFEHGVISYVNGPAEALGCRPGMTTAEAVDRLAGGPEFTGLVPEQDEARHLVRSESPLVWTIDSASLAGPDDQGSVILTGSHANLLGGRPETALKVDALAAFYNDAGDRPPEGCTRLPALDARGIAGVAVSAASARIGDAGSTYRDGVVSAVNETARRLGCAPGMSAIDCVDAIVTSSLREADMTTVTTAPAPAVPEEAPAPRRMVGGRALAEMLAVHEVGPMFGMGGFQLLPFYNAVRELGLTHHLIDDERSGAFAADAQTRVTGRVGVCDATLGPGATNLVTALVEALNAGSPVIAIVGDTNRDHSWKNMTQEAHQLEILRPAVKEVIRVEAGHRIPELVRRAFAVASSGRPGPVVLAVPEDVAHGEFEYGASDFWADPATLRVPARRTRPDADDVERAAALLGGAERPLILAGGGIHLSGAYDALLALAEANDIPVAHTLSGKGSIACTHRLSVGLFGRYSRFANELIESSDGLLVVGCKLGEIATKRYALPPAGTRMVHLDISAEELGRTTRAEIGLWGDARAGLRGPRDGAGPVAAPPRGVPGRGGRAAHHLGDGDGRSLRQRGVADPHGPPDRRAQPGHARRRDPRGRRRLRQPLGRAPVRHPAERAGLHRRPGVRVDRLRAPWQPRGEAGLAVLDRRRADRRRRPEHDDRRARDGPAHGRRLHPRGRQQRRLGLRQGPPARRVRGRCLPVERPGRDGLRRHRPLVRLRRDPGRATGGPGARLRRVDGQP